MTDLPPLDETLARQVAANGDLNLLGAQAAEQAIIHPRFHDALSALGARSARQRRALRPLARRAADLVADRAQALNQFVQVGAPARAELAALYENSLRELPGGSDNERFLRTVHYPRVAAWAGAFYPPALRHALAGAHRLSPVPCFEYSASLQSRILRLSPADLSGPLLDVGCGPRGQLVQDLRTRGVPAWGIDRSAGELPGLARCDWFEYPFQDGTWQCIVMHLSFSHHWAYTETHTPADLPRWSRTLGAMLQALRPGGSLVAAPAPATMLAAAPRGFRLRLWPVTQQDAAVRITREV